MVETISCSSSAQWFLCKPLNLLKVVWEQGIIGLILWIWLQVALIYEGLKVVKILKGQPIQLMAISILMFCVFFLIWYSKGHQVLGSTGTQIQVWFFYGILLKLPKLVAINKSLNQFRSA
jgi:hypothetical protein